MFVYFTKCKHSSDDWKAFVTVVTDFKGDTMPSWDCGSYFSLPTILLGVCHKVRVIFFQVK